MKEIPENTESKEASGVRRSATEAPTVTRGPLRVGDLLGETLQQRPLPLTPANPNNPRSVPSTVRLYCVKISPLLNRPLHPSAAQPGVKKLQLNVNKSPGHRISGIKCDHSINKYGKDPEGNAALLHIRS